MLSTPLSGTGCGSTRLSHIGAPQRGQCGAFSRFDNLSDEDVTALFQCWDRGRSYRLLTVDLVAFRALGPVLPLALPHSNTRLSQALTQVIIVHNAFNAFEESDEYKHHTSITFFKSFTTLQVPHQSADGTQSATMALIE